ncbi:hypothetical protein ACFSRY_01480 [Pontibacter locisalis]|uniref:Secreted protein n=1 Tax=Pontibacter locisalis TaxID=1719035 RepID=A0ABW5IHX9_9BACT
MLSLIVAIVVSLTVGTSTDLPANQNPNTGNTTEKPAKEKSKTSDPTLGTMGGTGHWAEG